MMAGMATDTPITFPDPFADVSRSTTWDIWMTAPNGDYVPLDDLTAFVHYLEVWLEPESVRVAAVRHFLTLPAAIPMPAKLRQACEEYIGG